MKETETWHEKEDCRMLKSEGTEKTKDGYCVEYSEDWESEFHLCASASVATPQPDSIADIL